MDLSSFLLGLIVGLLIATIAAVLIHKLLKKREQVLSDDLAQRAEKSNQALLEQVKASFQGLSSEALAKNTDQFFKIANETLSQKSEMGEKDLEGKKKLIDQSLSQIRDELKKVHEQVQHADKDRVKGFGELFSHLKGVSTQTTQLTETTAQLKALLASTKARGQWGERMAEDVLRLSGLIEGVNYLKQSTQENAGTRPDFTFLLPQDLKVNMDVKFPFNNYINFIESENEHEKEQFKKAFLRDVRNRMKEVTTREYINPADNTVDYALVFIPNEQVYAFINEEDQSILDDAMRNRIIFCSPMTLYAILAVMRQAVSNFHLERTGTKILQLFGEFYQQWEKFNESLDKVGKAIESSQKTFSALTTTRKRALERPLEKIEALREEQVAELAAKGVEEASSSTLLPSTDE